MLTPVELSNPVYHDDDAARVHMEAIRWPNGPFCPYCGVTGDSVKVLGSKAHGHGWYHCGECRKLFTVRVGTVCERSHIPLHKWMQAFRLYVSSKKGFSAHQLHRTLKITYRSAWFMAHRVREAMRDVDPEPLGGKDKVVEADETFIGKPGDVFVNGRGWVQMRGTATKRKVIALVERGGKSRAFHVKDIDAKTVRKVLGENVVLDSRLHTDEAHHYRIPGEKFAAHERVNHSAREYARGDVTTNTVEGYFSIFKRGMKGVYHHCGEAHLQRYLDEFNFRYSNRASLGIEDAERTTLAIKGIEGKRLTYRRTHKKAAA
ncbi:MAG: IS1595 family transposase [Candidatus Acidiferrales bacterium]